MHIRRRRAPRGPSIQARTAYQLVYPDGTVMIDSGMDLPVHKFFGRGVEEPYFPDQETKVAAALRKAKSIVVTHEHGDHVAGVLQHLLARQALLVHVGDPLGAAAKFRSAARQGFGGSQHLRIALVEVDGFAQRLLAVPGHVDKDLQPVALGVAEIDRDRIAVRGTHQFAGVGLSHHPMSHFAQHRQIIDAKRNLVDHIER